MGNIIFIVTIRENVLRRSRIGLEVYGIDRRDQTRKKRAKKR